MKNKVAKIRLDDLAQQLCIPEAKIRGAIGLYTPLEMRRIRRIDKLRTPENLWNAYEQEPPECRNIKRVILERLIEVGSFEDYLEVTECALQERFPEVAVKAQDKAEGVVIEKLTKVDGPDTISEFYHKADKITTLSTSLETLLVSRLVSSYLIHNGFSGIARS